MIIGDKKLEALKKMPVIETVVFKSKDGKYIVNKTTITDIKPVNYFQAVLDNEPKE
jgi:NACalpha-BTF3-like transcription factor